MHWCSKLNQRESCSLEKHRSPLSFSHAKVCTNVGKRKKDFRLRLKLTAKQRKIGRNRPTCPTTNPSAKLAAFSDRGGGDGDEQDYRHHDHPDFDGWGGSHAGSVNTGMEIEEKLSGGFPPSAQADCFAALPWPQIFCRVV